MRDHLDTHVAARFMARFGLAISLNDLLWIEREITSGTHRRAGVQSARDAGHGHPGHRERHLYSLALPVDLPDCPSVVLVCVVWDPESGRVVSVLPPDWTIPGRDTQDESRKDPRDDAYRERAIADAVGTLVGAHGYHCRHRCR
jgi:hypothetical protein